MKSTKEIGIEVAKMAEPEARRGKMLRIDPNIATNQIESGRAFYEVRDGKIVSYGAFDEMRECVEIRSIIIREDYRHQGFAVKMTEKIIIEIQKVLDKPIIVLGNSESKGVMRKLGLRQADKLKGFPELWQECLGCAEYDKWPNCHCQYMRLFGKVHKINEDVFSIIDLANGDSRDFNEVAKLYCEIWKEPPWNENQWVSQEVEKDFKRNIARANGCAKIAVHKNEIVGFTSGWNIGPDEIKKRTGGIINPDQLESQQMFYIAELAAKAKNRHMGIGKKLSSDLIEKAKANGAKSFLLRTNIAADAARALYRSIGFVELAAKDSTFTDRTYWIL